MPFDASSAVLDEEAPAFDASSASPEFDASSAVEEQPQGVTATSSPHPVASAGSIPAPATVEAPTPNPITEFGKAFSGTIFPQVAGAARVTGLKGIADFLSETTPEQSPDEGIVTGIAQGAGSAAALLAETAVAKNPYVPAVALGLGAYDTAYTEAKQQGKSEEDAVSSARMGMLKTVPQMAAYVIGIGTGTKLASIIAKRLGYKNTATFISRTLGGATGGQTIASGEAVLHGQSPMPTPESITQNLIFGGASAVHGALRTTETKLNESIKEAEELAEPAKGETDALSKPETTQPDVNVQQPPGAPESAGQVPAAEGGAGVPARGQGAEVRAEVAKTFLDKLDSNETTLRDVANELAVSEDAPASLKAAADDVLRAVKEDREVYGERSGLPEEAEARLQKALQEHSAGEQSSITAPTQESAATDVSAITKARTREEMISTGGRLIASAKTDAEMQQVQSAMKAWKEPPSPLAGPALKPTEGEPLKGKIGDEHGQMKIEAAQRGEDFTEAEHGFHDADGNFLSRTEAAQRTLDTGLIDQAKFDEVMARKEPGLTSQDLKRFTDQKSAAPKAPAVPVPDVAPHLKTAPEVKAILDEQPAQTEPGMKAPEVPPEAGAAGGTGGKRPPPPRAGGVTPRGDRNWLRIPHWVKRIGRGLFTEGARGVLIRSKNAVGQALGKATRRHVDLEQELFGQHEKILRDAVSAISKGRRDAVWTEVSQHIRDIENGRPTTALQPDAQQLLDAWYEIGEKTGDIARANGVMVAGDPAVGGYRPMGHVQNYIPRMFSKEVEAALRDPDSNPTLYNNLAQAIATHRGITLEAAQAELRKTSGRFSSNDFHGNLELARTGQLPEIFYEYDLRNLAARYLPAFSERMAQIIAFGQRLGPREAPLRKNLWDIARDESRDPDTQQWLNAAEDQASGFKSKSVIERNARRGQAIANATLLSDPTTTVVRNALSGLAVTAERYGVGRTMKALYTAARHAKDLDPKELGVLREDIGSFLGAEQLGDSALDTAIRGGQQKMLKWAGFSASENLVRRTNAIAASTFARNAAASLASNPRAALSREALAHFKRFDVDPELIVSEGGNWKTGPETRKYIRTSVRESQGGYRYDQVPIWAGTTAGRFLYQYGRWGIQRANDIFKNTIRPLIGEDVEFRGQKMKRRNVMPAIRLGMLTVGLGETFGAIASVIFGKDRKDASFDEIGEAFTDEEASAVGLLGERILNDVIMAGTLGLIGQPVDFAKSLKDQSRFKNPAEPPSLAGTKALLDLALRAKDQGGTLTKRDLLDTAKSVVRGPVNVSEVVRNVADEKLYEAQNDQRTLRNAARRWAKSQGMDVASKMGFDAIRKSLNAPVFEEINSALLSGDANRARQVANDFVDSKKTDEEQKKARAAVESSVEGRHPFRAGPFTADKHREAFLEWADKNLSPADRAQIERVIATYEETAQEADL